MTVTLSDAIRRVRSNFDEPTASFLTDTAITDWVNDGNRDQARRSENLWVFDTSITISANVAVYALPSDIIRIHRMEFVPTGSIQTYPVLGSTQMQMDQIWGINQQSPSSYPSYFVMRGYPGGSSGTGRDSTFKIQLYPMPSQAGSLNLYYFRMPYRFLDPIANPSELAKTLDVPDGWDDLTVLYAEYNALRKDRDDRWKDVKALYDEQVEYLLNVTREWHDNPNYFTTHTRVAQPTWLTEFWD